MKREKSHVVEPLNRQARGRENSISGRVGLVMVLLLLTACSTTISTIQESPGWYRNLTAEEGRLIGYGEGANYPEAKTNALGDIAEQREVWVASQFNLLRQSSNEKISTATIKTVRIKSEKRLSSVTELKHQQHNNRHYIALQLDLRPIEQIIADKITAASNIRWQGATALVHGALLKRVTQRHRNHSDTNRTTTIAVALNRENDRWILNLNNQIVALDALDTLLNWQPYQKPGYDLTLTQKAGKTDYRLQKGTAFRLIPAAPAHTLDRGEAEYLTLTNISSDGRVAILLDSTLAKTIKQFPAEDAEREMIALPVNLEIPDRELYLALWSPQPLDLTPYHQTGYRLEKRESDYRHERIIRRLDQQQITAIAPRYIEIQP